jgi:integrase/recombinase XerC
MLVCQFVNDRKMASQAFYKFCIKTKQLEASPLLKHKALKSQKNPSDSFSEKEVVDVLRCNNTTGLKVFEINLS